MENKYQIKEISEIVGLPVDTIRYYDKIGLLSSDRESGNRYRQFEENEIGNMQSVMALRGCNVPIDKIRKFFCSCDLNDLCTSLMETQEEIQHMINQLYQKQNDLLQLYADMRQIYTQFDTIVLRQSPIWYVSYIGKERNIRKLVQRFNYISQEIGLLPSYAYFTAPESFQSRDFFNYSERGILTDSNYQDNALVPVKLLPRKCVYYVFCIDKNDSLTPCYEQIYTWLERNHRSPCGDIIQRYRFNTPQKTIGEIWVPIE